MITCPHGHESDTDDYCDTCGTAMGGSATPDPASTDPAEEVREGASDPQSEPGSCSNCDSPRGPDDVFCEVCGLDFATGALPAAPAAPAPLAEEPEAAPTGKPSGWVVVIEPDRDWFQSQEADGVDLDFPTSTAAREITLTSEIATVGRRSDRDAWYPTVDLGGTGAGGILDDPAVSRRHAEFRPTADGWQLVDTGSTNGTHIGGETLTPDVPRDLADGDVVHVGVFTRLTMKQATS